MRRNKFSSVVLAGAFLLFTGPGAGLAQTPGGSPSMPQAPSRTTPTHNTQDPTMNNPADSQMSSTKVDDKKFATDAAEGGFVEVELAKLALQKSSSSDVKQFAQKMVDDHTKANDELKQVATKDNLQIPTSLDSKHQARIDKLGKLSGDRFDKAYAKDQLKDHENDVKQFSLEAQSGTDPNLKAFASSTLPVLQEHLEMAKTLNKAAK